MGSWPFMNKFYHLEDQWPGLMMDSGHRSVFMVLHVYVFSGGEWRRLGWKMGWREENPDFWISWLQARVPGRPATWNWRINQSQLNFWEKLSPVCLVDRTLSRSTGYTKNWENWVSVNFWKRNTVKCTRSTGPCPGQPNTQELQRNNWKWYFSHKPRNSMCPVDRTH